MRPGDPGYDDCFRPPGVPTEVHCIHCDNEYDSYLIEWRAIDPANPNEGFWCCPIPGCDGKGFCFDIWPTDPEWRDESGQQVFFSCDDDSEDGEELDAMEFLDEVDETIPDDFDIPFSTLDEDDSDDEDAPIRIPLDENGNLKPRPNKDSRKDKRANEPYKPFDEDDIPF